MLIVYWKILANDMEVKDSQNRQQNQRPEKLKVIYKKVFCVFMQELTINLRQVNWKM